MIKIAIIQCDTADELRATLDKMSMDEKHIFASILNEPQRINKLISDEVKVNEHGEVDGKTLEKLLLLKGYRVKSLDAKKRTCTKLYIRSTKRGIYWKYLLADIERVPSRISTSLAVRTARERETDNF